MRENDRFFLWFGRDLKSDKVDEYPIYKRNKVGKKFDYHFLDIARREKFIRNQCEYNPNVISKFEDVMWVLAEIVENPNSYLKRYIESITVSVHVLRGLNDLLGDTGESDGVPEFISNATPDGEKIRCNPASYVSLDLPEHFNDPFSRYYTLGRRATCESTLYKSYPDHMLARRKFPTEVYSKEVTGTSIMLGFAENKYHNKKLHELESYKELCKMNPYDEWNNNPYIENKGVRNTEEKEKALLSVREFLSVSIESLDNFTTKEKAQSILKRTITSVMNPENTSGINVRMLISGPRVDSELNPEPIPFELHRVGENYLAFNIIPETRYDPVLFLLRN